MHARMPQTLYEGTATCQTACSKLQHRYQHFRVLLCLY